MTSKDVATRVDIAPTRAMSFSERFGFLRGLTLAGLLLAMWIALAIGTTTFLTPTNFVNLAALPQI